MSEKLYSICYCESSPCKCNAPTPATAEKTATPKCDTAEATLRRWEKRAQEAGLRGSHLDSDDPQPKDGWAVARTLEASESRLVAKVEELLALNWLDEDVDHLRAELLALCAQAKPQT